MVRGARPTVTSATWPKHWPDRQNESERPSSTSIRLRRGTRSTRPPACRGRSIATIVDTLAAFRAVDLQSRFDHLGRTFTERGVTFAHDGEERPFPLDLIPRIITALEWDGLAAGIRQRVLALEAFLDDVYGRGRCFADGVIPRALVTSSTHFHREAHGISSEHAARITVSGIDVIRDESGRFRVLEDNVRIPSGVSYVIENRRAMTQVFGSLFSKYRVHPVDAYPARLLRALRRSAPEGVRDPSVVVLTPVCTTPRTSSTSCSRASWASSSSRAATWWCWATTWS